MAELAVTAFTALPELLGERELLDSLHSAGVVREVMDAGVEGMVLVHLFVDDVGVVRRTLLARTSGVEELDWLVLAWGCYLPFTPAVNDNAPVPMWITIPVTFYLTREPMIGVPRSLRQMTVGSSETRKLSGLDCDAARAGERAVADSVAAAEEERVAAQLLAAEASGAQVHELRGVS